MKYGEEWTGDVWKVIYHVLRKYLDNIIFGYFYNINYRGVFYMNLKESFQIPEKDIEEINNYEYFSDFNHYLELLSTHHNHSF